MKIALVTFSGTGNTQALAEMMGVAFDQHAKITLFAMEEIVDQRVSFSPEGFDLLGIGHPVYGFHAPQQVFDFIQTLPRQREFQTFLYVTCAGPSYWNEIATFHEKRALSQKGYRVFYERLFYFPANIAMQYPKDICKQLFVAAQRKATRMAEELLQGKETRYRHRIGPVLLTPFYACEKWGWRSIGKDFRVLPSCTRCRICVEACPAHNVYENDGIRFGTNCQACYRCVYRCPQRAITGRKYRFLILPQGYDVKAILNDSTLPGNTITPKTRGYYGIFKRYLFKA